MKLSVLAQTSITLARLLKYASYVKNDYSVSISLPMRGSEVRFPGWSNRTQSRHRSDVLSGLCFLGAMPRRWVPPLAPLGVLSRA